MTFDRPTTRRFGNASAQLAEYCGFPPMPPPGSGTTAISARDAPSLPEDATAGDCLQVARNDRLVTAYRSLEMIGWDCLQVVRNDRLATACRSFETIGWQLPVGRSKRPAGDCLQVVRNQSLATAGRSLETTRSRMLGVGRRRSACSVRAHPSGACAADRCRATLALPTVELSTRRSDPKRPGQRTR